VSNAGSAIICAYCGAESPTWTAFCVRCGVPRAAAGPGGPVAPDAPGHAAQVPQAAPLTPPPGFPGAPAAQPVPAYAAPAYAGAPTAQQPGQYPAQFQARPPVEHGAPAPQPVTFVAPGLSEEFDGLRPAGVGRRIGAFAIDSAAVALVSGVVFVITGFLLYAGLAVAELSVGLLIWEANRGKTLGNLLLRLRTTRAEKPRNAGPGRAIVRGLVVLGGSLVASVGQWVVVASSAWDSSGRGQGWHDKAGRTVTVALPAGKRTTSRRLQNRRVAATPQPQPVAAPVAEAEPAALSTPLTPAGFVSAAAVDAASVVPASVVPTPAPAVAAEAAQRAQAIEYVTPTVISTRAVIEEVDDDSFSDSGRLPPAAAPLDVAETPTIDRIPAMLFAFDTGQQVQVTNPGTGVIGRNPRVFTEGDQLIAVEDPAKSVSKSHLLFQISGASMQVLDHGSTNGSEIFDDEGESIPVVANQWTAVPPGSRIRVGQRVFTINAVEVSR